jgi:hypothetical protein
VQIEVNRYALTIMVRWVNRAKRVTVSHCRISTLPFQKRFGGATVKHPALDNTAREQAE